MDESSGFSGEVVRFTISQIVEALSPHNIYYAGERLGHRPTDREALIYYAGLLAKGMIVWRVGPEAFLTIDEVVEALSPFNRYLAWKEGVEEGDLAGILTHFVRHRFDPMPYRSACSVPCHECPAKVGCAHFAERETEAIVA